MQTKQPVKTPLCRTWFRRYNVFKPLFIQPTTDGDIATMHEHLKDTAV